jgi:hypothetical protein
MLCLEVRFPSDLISADYNHNHGRDEPEHNHECWCRELKGQFSHRETYLSLSDSAQLDGTVVVELRM